MKLTFFTTCKGRLHHLRETLPANLAATESLTDVEFLVIDYNSQDGMAEWAERELAEHVASGRLIYIREKTAPYHSTSHPKNILLQFATGDVVVNLDADNYMAPGYVKAVLDVYAERRDVFVTSPQIAVKGDPKDGTYGRIAYPLEMFGKLRGYDETFKGWGGEEWDFMARAKAAGYLQVKLKAELIGSAIGHTDEERYLKNYDPSCDRLLTNEANMRASRARPAGDIVNYPGYGKATVYKNFSKDPIKTGIGQFEGAVKVAPPEKLGWGKSRVGPQKRILATILDYTARPGVLMSKAWIVQAKKHCPDWDIVIMHAGDIPEIMEFAGRFDGIRFQQMDLASNAIRKELSGEFGTNAQNYKIPFLKHVHDAEWPPFVFVDADAMIFGDISALAEAGQSKPFVATTESRPHWMNGLRVVNSGVFAYTPESRLLSYERLHEEWLRWGKILKYPTGEQGLIIPLLHREGYDWEHPLIGPEYNAFGHAAVLDKSDGRTAVRILKTPGEGTPEWVTWWVGWGCEKEARIVHSISKWKWWTLPHLDPIWQHLVAGVYAEENSKKEIKV